MSRENAVAERPQTIAVYSYPWGGVDGVTYVPRSGRSPESVVDSIILPGQLSDEVQEEYKQRGIRSARTRMSRQINWETHRKLVTFTVAGDDVPNPRELLRMGARWWREGGKLLLPDGGLVLKPERGDKNGRTHLHGTVRDEFFPYMPVIDSWTAFVESCGYHSPTGYHAFVAGDGKGAYREPFGSPRHSAGYLSSYVSKDWDDPCWVKGARKWESMGCDKPVADVYGGFALSEIPEVLYQEFGCCSNGTGARLSPYYDRDGQLSGYRFHNGK